MPTPSPLLNPVVAVLVYDGLCLFEFGCVAEVFGLPRPEAGPHWYRFVTASVDGLPIRTQYAGQLTPDAGLDAIENAGTVVIPGWASPETPVPAVVVEALRAAHARGARLLSICSGIFVLAATGLLDGQRATTHWRHAAQLARTHPAIHVDPDVLYVDNGQLLTSAGSAAGLDLCLHLVRRDFDHAMANQVARRLVIPPHREGGQAQFVERPVQAHTRNGLASLLDELQRTLDQPHSLAGMARRANLSPRTLIRRFKAATGETPGQWLLQQRLRLSRDLLEHSTLSIDQIAERSGLGSGITLRHHYRHKLQTSPATYRRQFGKPVAGN